MLLLALLSAATAEDTSLVFSGRANQLQVPIPRIEASVTVDGHLDEPVWARAARLTGFSQFQPVDGRPAEEATEVLVWYGPIVMNTHAALQTAIAELRAGTSIKEG